MSRPSFWLSALAIVATASLGATGAAKAQNLEACGNIYVSAGAECEVIPPSASCDVMCTPISVRAACAAELKVNCDARCDVDVDVGCTGSCTLGCEAQCNIDPGEFDCHAYCQGGCSGECTARCAAGEGGAQCRASCEATCSGDCNASCKVRPPSADCKARCEASCEGSCHAKANIDCQAQCQASGFIECEADIQGGCKADCMTQEGALFCEGRYVDSGNNLQMCITALRDALDVEVTYDADAQGECGGGMCSGKAEASASSSCSTLPGQKGSAASLAFFALGLVAYGARRRRTR